MPGVGFQILKKAYSRSRFLEVCAEASYRACRRLRMCPSLDMNASISMTSDKWFGAVFPKEINVVPQIQRSTECLFIGGKTYKVQLLVCYFEGHVSACPRSLTH